MPTADFEVKEVTPSNEMSLTANDDMLAGMQASESYKVRAENGAVLGSGGETRAFGKYNFDPETASPMVAINIANTSGPLFNNANMTNDENIGGDRNLLTRAVASSQLDQFIGLNVLAEEKFGLDGEGENQRMVGISVQVDGAGMTGKQNVNVNGAQVEQHAFLGITPEDGGFQVSAELQNDAGIPNHLKGYANPNIQKGLSDLEVMDYISGQIDRHPGNIFINPANGQVKGIDNDLAFPEKDRARVLAGDTALREKMVQGMPKMIHQDTAQKILATDPEAMRAALQGVQRPDGEPGLSAEEIDGAVNRLKEMQNAIRNPDSVPGIQVVQQFDDNTFRQAVEQQRAAFQQQKGQAVEAGQLGSFNDAYRTSYLGAAVLAEKQKSLEIAETPDRNAIRPAATVTGAARNAAYVEYAQMADAAKQEYKAKPQLIADPNLQQQAVNLKQQIAEAKAKIAHYEKETAKLEQGKLGAKFRSLASGGTEGRKEFYADKKMAAQQQLANMEREFDKVAAEAVPVELKQGLKADADAAVLARQPAVALNANGVMQPDPVVLANAPNYPAPPPPGQFDHAPPNYPAPPPPGQFDHAPPNYPAPPVPDQDNLALGNDQPKVAKAKIPAKSVQAVVDGQPGAIGVDNAENNQPKLDVQKAGLQKKPSVGDMLKKSNSSPALGGLQQAVGEEEHKPAANSLRASGGWQAAKPSGPKPGGGSLTKSV